MKLVLASILSISMLTVGVFARTSKVQADNFIFSITECVTGSEQTVCYGANGLMACLPKGDTTWTPC